MEIFTYTENIVIHPRFIHPEKRIDKIPAAYEQQSAEIFIEKTTFEEFTEI